MKTSIGIRIVIKAFLLLFCCCLFSPLCAQNFFASGKQFLRWKEYDKLHLLWHKRCRNGLSRRQQWNMWSQASSARNRVFDKVLYLEQNFGRMGYDYDADRISKNLLATSKLLELHDFTQSRHQAWPADKITGFSAQVAAARGLPRINAGWSAYHHGHYGNALDHYVYNTYQDTLNEQRRQALLAATLEAMAEKVEKIHHSADEVRLAHSVALFRRELTDRGFKPQQLACRPPLSSRYVTYGEYIDARMKEGQHNLQAAVQAARGNKEYVNAKRLLTTAINALIGSFEKDRLVGQLRELMAEGRTYYRNQITHAVGQHDFLSAKKSTADLQNLDGTINVTRIYRSIDAAKEKYDCLQRVRRFRELQDLEQNKRALQLAKEIDRECRKCQGCIPLDFDVERAIDNLNIAIGYEYVVTADSHYENEDCLRALAAMKEAFRYIPNAGEPGEKYAIYKACGQRVVKVVFTDSEGMFGHLDQGATRRYKEQLVSQLRNRLAGTAFGRFTQIVTSNDRLSKAPDYVLQFNLRAVRYEFDWGAPVQTTSTILRTVFDPSTGCNVNRLFPVTITTWHNTANAGVYYNAYLSKGTDRYLMGSGSLFETWSQTVRRAPQGVPTDRIRYYPDPGQCGLPNLMPEDEFTVTSRIPSADELLKAKVRGTTLECTRKAAGKIDELMAAYPQ